MLKKIYNSIRKVFDKEWGETLQRNFPFKFKGKTYWYSRSCATAAFIYCMDKNGVMYVLACKRGKGAADYQGYWNVPCGYLEYNLHGKENMVKELKEETSIEINKESLRLVSVESNPKANRQNVTLRYGCIIADKTIDDFKFNLDNMEPDEVEDVKWVQFGKHKNLQWAYNHDMRITQVYGQLIRGYNLEAIED